MKKSEVYEIIKDIYMDKKNRELAEMCGVSLSTIKRTMQEYGLSRDKIHQWTDDELDYLISNVDTMTNKEIANHLNLTLDTVKMKIRKEGIKRKGFKDPVDEISGEEWKIVEGATNYSVSNMGRIKNNKGNYLLQLYTSNFGYKTLSLIHDDGKRRPHRLHRIVAEAFIDNPSNKPEVNHIDGDKTNNKVSNLEWVTSSENKIHAYLNGLMVPPPMETRIQTDLTEDDVRQVCQMLEDDKSYDEILQATGVNKNIISQIKRHKTWKEISSEYKF